MGRRRAVGFYTKGRGRGRKVIPITARSRYVPREVVRSKPKEKREWLDTRLVVYVPSTYHNKKISDKEFDARIKETADYITRLFKGTTRFRAKGTYASGKNNGVVEEQVSTIESYATKESWEEHQKEFYDWLHDKRIEWGQESIAFEKETDMTFIEKHP